MNNLLDEVTGQLAITAARELDKRLLWDMVMAYGNGVSLTEMAIGEWPDSAKSIIRNVKVGEYAEVLGPRRRIRWDYTTARVTVTVE